MQSTAYTCLYQVLRVRVNRFLTFSDLRLQVPRRRPLVSRCYPPGVPHCCPLSWCRHAESIPVDPHFLLCRRTCPSGFYVIDPVFTEQFVVGRFVLTPPPLGSVSSFLFRHSCPRGSHASIPFWLHSLGSFTVDALFSSASDEPALGRMTSGQTEFCVQSFSASHLGFHDIKPSF